MPRDGLWLPIGAITAGAPLTPPAGPEPEGSQIIGMDFPDTGGGNTHRGVQFSP